APLLWQWTKLGLLLQLHSGIQHANPFPTRRSSDLDYPLAPWPPDKEFSMDVAEKEMISGTSWTRLYYYVVPARVQGAWELTLPRDRKSTRLNSSHVATSYGVFWLKKKRLRKGGGIP